MHTDSTPLPAGLLRRLAAMIYDGLLIIGLWILATAALLPLTDGEAVSSGSWLYRGYLIAIAFLFFAAFWTRDGQTLGMKAWRIRVQQPDGGCPSWSQASVRFVVAACSAAALGLGYLWQYVDNAQRSWHDIASGTEVVRLPRSRRERQ